METERLMVPIVTYLMSHPHFSIALVWAVVAIVSQYKSVR